MSCIEHNIDELLAMKKYPSKLFYEGNLELLEKKKISIVGTRKPSKYTKQMVFHLSQKLSLNDICVVSGGAMGVDALAHSGAKSSNTIAVLPCGIDLKYPAVNKNLLVDIEQNGLLLSQFEMGFKATPWSFVVRNELVVALGDVLVVAEAELNSGSMRSVEFALEMGKQIFVLPHRLGESGATQKLLEDGKATCIYSLDSFVENFSEKTLHVKQLDEFEKFCSTNPIYDEVLKKFPQRFFEAELNGDVKVVDGRVFLV